MMAQALEAGGRGGASAKRAHATEPSGLAGLPPPPPKRVARSQTYAGEALLAGATQALPPPPGSAHAGERRQTTTNEPLPAVPRGDESEDEDAILASALAAVGREARAAGAAVIHDRLLFKVRARALLSCVRVWCGACCCVEPPHGPPTGAPTTSAHTRALPPCPPSPPPSYKDPNFTVVLPEGVVPPHSETEVTVQFSPDYTREYEVAAYVEVQGRTDRLPVVFKAKGLVSARARARTVAHSTAVLLQLRVRGVQGRGAAVAHAPLGACTSAPATRHTGVLCHHRRAPLRCSATTCWTWATRSSTRCTSEWGQRPRGHAVRAVRLLACSPAVMRA